MAQTLVVELTDDQYTRFKAGLKKLLNMETDPSDELLTSYMKREAAALTSAAENNGLAAPSNWTF